MSEMLKQVQHDIATASSFLVIPNQVLNLLQHLTISGSRFKYVASAFIADKDYLWIPRTQSGKELGEF
jgi:hypothetical protein